MFDVIVVGGGPVGLLLAGELRLAGVEPLVLEAAAGTERRRRSLGLRSVNARSTQTLALRGLDEPLAQAQEAQFKELTDSGSADLVAFLARAVRDGQIRGHFAGLPLLTEAPGKADYFLLKQHLLEQVLADWAIGLGAEIRHDRQVTDISDAGDHVLLTLAGGRTLEARYVVGCDGGRSTVRKRAGFAFPGTPPTMTGRTAVATLADPTLVASDLRGPGGLVNLSLVPGEIATIEYDGGPEERDEPMTAEELQASIRRVSGVEVKVSDLEVGIRYSDNTRLAEPYRKGRILLAGDAAHVHSPIGGQGLNLGIQDAANLGWKLALVVKGQADEDLLDTYTAERRPVAERVLRNTRAQVALMRPGAQVDALREVLAETLELPDAKRHFIAMANGADIDYAPHSAHPMVGRFLPDVELHDGRGLLIGLNTNTDDRVRHAGKPAPDGLTAALVRPDGYVAWATSSGDVTGLTDALTHWFGRLSSG
ncbi:FAD-dependent monooxygenase [Nonomuraea endophytica]|uniref:2-polyprenyl-6-methoxyphenol hydroxylase-like FAD-dependent oxidoreductase n=1 Tax=Nonomuraea endophytica TaxID=714136 RepID=A0A7W8ED71_9ACTN|nr:FAD-dependent monooxygenase [Nonomuraea endophytica]MBB5076270.1 2-polyprenyl-6-methoxyphenol hydroxylase-like FAD-dependent oxidoreductase [Nonomuraea endophytica]